MSFAISRDRINNKTIYSTNILAIYDKKFENFSIDFRIFL